MLGLDETKGSEAHLMMLGVVLERSQQTFHIRPLLRQVAWLCTEAQHCVKSIEVEPASRLKMPLADVLMHG